MNTSNIKRVTATGDVTTADAYLRAVTLTGDGTNVPTLTVRAGGAGGTIILAVRALATATVAVDDLHDAYCADGIHATLAGTGAEATFVYA